MPKIKTARLEAHQRLHSRYKSEDNDFLYSSVKKDEIGCITTTRNRKASHLDIVTPLPPERKKSKTQPSAGKCMLRVFWDYRGIKHKKYMVKGIRINSRTYMKTLKRPEQQTAFNGEKR
jgi:hypothetical protein